MAENILEIRHLSKSFGSNEVLRDIDFTVEKGDVSSRVIFMHKGVICEQGAPEDVFGHPQQQETRDFLTRFRRQ